VGKLGAPDDWWQLFEVPYRVFGIGGCVVFGAALDQAIKYPWRKLKTQYFGGEIVRLHATELKNPSAEQLSALETFFRSQQFGRFAVTATARTVLPPNKILYEIMPAVVRKRWQELASRTPIAPVELAFIHEASDRGDPLLEKFFGETVVHVEGVKNPVHHGLMPKSIGDEALEVADFIVQAAGRQAHRWADGDKRIRKDFAAVFHSNPSWVSFMDIGRVEVGAVDTKDE
jgi:hypothetical protein